VPFDPDIDHSLRRIHTVATGPLTFADMKAHLEMAAAAAGAAGYPELIDARGATVSESVTLDEVRRAALYLRGMALSGPLGRVAVVADVERTFGLLRQLAMLAGDACKIEPFREAAEARIWLGWGG
jgi:hypothetical protein